MRRSLEQSIDDIGLVPGPAPRRDDRQGIGRPGRVEEDVETLARGKDPRQRMDRRAAQPAWLAAPVPVLVQIEDGVADRVVEARLSCDRGTTFATDLFHLVPLSSTTDPDRDQATETERERFGRGQGAHRHRCVGEDAAFGRRLAGLERDLVRAEDPGDGRRVR